MNSYGKGKVKRLTSQETRHAVSLVIVGFGRIAFWRESGNERKRSLCCCAQGRVPVPASSAAVGSNIDLCALLA